jgi:hypothetical protein
VNTRGRVVGINTLIFTQGGGNHGVGFASPSNIVRSVYAQIRTNGRVRRGDIGVRPQTITPVLAAPIRPERRCRVVEQRREIGRLPAQCERPALGMGEGSQVGKPTPHGRCQPYAYGYGTVPPCAIAV